MQREPTNGRVPQDDGTTKTLKMSIGKKKLHADGPEGLTRMMCKTMILNGVQYCRRHLMIRCHLCEEDSWFLKEEVDNERHTLGLRDGGDPKLTERAKRWSDYILDKNMQKTMQRDALIYKYGKNHAKTNPENWIELTRQWGVEEREINNRFLAENDDVVKNQGTSQCCYWACKTPIGKEGNKLLKCSGCGIAKYCCRDHQALDWKWEHKGECTISLPEWFRVEIESDRQRNLNGDYSDYKD